MGVYQFAAVTVLEPFGISRESALTLVFLLQGLDVGAVAILGGWGLWRFRRYGPQAVSSV